VGTRVSTESQRALTYVTYVGSAEVLVELDGEDLALYVSPFDPEKTHRSKGSTAFPSWAPGIEKKEPVAVLVEWDV
jgi:hypothetical protein